MQLRHWKSAAPATDGINRVTSLCWSPDGKKLAVATMDRVVTLYDEDGNKKDKFSTKPSTDKGPKTYVIKQMAFSPLSDKIALAQSDNIVYIYKIGVEWGEKKSICNKFPHSSPVNCLTWPVPRQNDVVYALAEGKLKIGQTKANKSSTLYETEGNYVTAIATNRQGTYLVSAHIDGSIYTFNLDNTDRGPQLIARHSCAAFALTWGSSIAVAGSDSQVVFYDSDGGVENSFDMSDRPECHEFTCASTNPTGDTVVLGNFDSLYLYSRNNGTMGWEEMSVARVENMYSATCMDWKPDGGKIALGTLCGAVDIYDVSMKRILHKGKFEITHVSASQVIVRNVDSNVQVVLRSRNGFEITKTNVYAQRFVVANTSDTLLLGDMISGKTSEVKWVNHSTGTGANHQQEKYIFDNESVCVIYWAGEVSIVEYGQNDFLSYFRTSFVNKHVFSLRISEQVHKNEDAHGRDKYSKTIQKTVAYLIDLQTICIRDLLSSQTRNNGDVISHDAKIDWLMLNEKATMLLFRDKSQCLYVYRLATQARTMLISHCTYVQWVPRSDVVVAQNRSNLCVWYNMDSPDQVSTKPIKGDIEEIERGEGQTLVIVDEGLQQAVYPLDEALINFSSAIDDYDLTRAMNILDRLEVTSEVEEMWKQLYSYAVEADDLSIAIRCSAATGDIATADYLFKLKASMEEILKNTNVEMRDHYLFRARMALLRRDLNAAENEYISHGKVDECIEMYRSLQKFDAAIRVAEQARHPNEDKMRHDYFEHLLDSKQYELAAVLKEKENDSLQAIDLYLKGNMPAKATRIIFQNKISQPMQLLETIVASLNRNNLYDVAGDFYEYLDDFVKAVDSYEKGHAYRKAVDLSRKCFPARVVELQEKWGDYLVSTHQVDMAINHYIEAKSYQKAIEAALNARQYPRAMQLVKVIDDHTSKPYYLTLGRYYEETGQYDQAEKCYLASGEHILAVTMHTKLGNWEVANKLASAYMSQNEIALMYINHAQSMESQGRFKDAERLYLTVKEADLAIAMYKKYKRFDDMVRVVKDQRPELLKETHQYLAHALEMEGALRDAENHYVDASEWQSAVNMYRSNDLWDDSIRVAKTHGGIAACKRMTLALLIALGVTDGSKYLIKHSLVDAAIEHAVETAAFDIAFEVAQQNLVTKLPYIHLKHALYLEDNERFEEAEKEFISAGKPREAIEMYMHIEDWSNATRVAESYDPPSIPDVHIQQGKLLVEAKNFPAAEEHFLIASRPELVLDMYREAGMFQEALKIAQTHLPHLVPEINASLQAGQFRSGGGGNGNKQANKASDIAAMGKSYEQKGRWNDAIELYLNSSDNDLNLLERAIEVARTNVPNRTVEIAVEVSKRLTKLKREEQAATILFEVGRFDDAINICLTAKKFEKAKQLANGNPALMKKVNESYHSYLTVKQDATELMDNGRMDVALDVLAQKGEWDRLWEIIGRENISSLVVGKFVTMRTNELLLRGTVDDVDEAVKILNKRMVPANESSLPLLRKITRQVLSRQLEEEGPSFIATVKLLREALYRLAIQFKADASDNGNDAVKNEIYELLMSIHYHYMMHLSISFGLKELAAKCAITLLKFPFVVPQDKAFYQAGMLCRELKNTNLAFMILNRYVDIAESIDTQNPNFMDDSEFQVADAVPLNGPLPNRHFVKEEDTREEVRTWILSIVTDSSVEQRFPSREQCRGTLYEGLFASQRKSCIVSGFPVHPADLLEVNNSIANRRDWNAIVAKTHLCPWTSQQQNPMY